MKFRPSKTIFSIKDKKLRDIDLAKDYPTFKDLIKELGVATDSADYWDKKYEVNFLTQMLGL